MIDEVATDPSSCISTIGFPNSMPKTSCNRNRKEALDRLGNISQRMVTIENANNSYLNKRSI